MQMDNADNTIFKKKLFNPDGDTELSLVRMIGGNATNLNDFNNVKYDWCQQWYRQAMNNFWIPEEINLTQDILDYRNLSKVEREAFDKILSFLIFLDSIQTANLPNIADYITASEVNSCLTIHAFQEVVHSQSYGYMLETICSPEERNKILYYWKDDKHLLARNKFIGDLYDEFQDNPSPKGLVKTAVANYILEGIYFYSGFMFFYNLGRHGKMSGSMQEIRYINRDENTHLWLFRSILLELKKENPELFTPELIIEYIEMIKTGVEQEITWGQYVLGDNIKGISSEMLESYLKYLGNLRSTGLGFGVIYEGFERCPDSMLWVNDYADPNLVKTDFFEARPSAYSKSGAIKDDL